MQHNNLVLNPPPKILHVRGFCAFTTEFNLAELPRSPSLALEYVTWLKDHNGRGAFSMDNDCVAGQIPGLAKAYLKDAAKRGLVTETNFQRLYSMNNKHAFLDADGVVSLDPYTYIAWLLSNKGQTLYLTSTDLLRYALTQPRFRPFVYDYFSSNPVKVVLRGEFQCDYGTAPSPMSHEVASQLFSFVKATGTLVLPDVATVTAASDKALKFPSQTSSCQYMVPLPKQLPFLLTTGTGNLLATELPDILDRTKVAWDTEAWSPSGKLIFKPRFGNCGVGILITEEGEPTRNLHGEIVTDVKLEPGMDYVVQPFVKTLYEKELRYWVGPAIRGANQVGGPQKPQVFNQTLTAQEDGETTGVDAGRHDVGFQGPQEDQLYATAAQRVFKHFSDMVVEHSIRGNTGLQLPMRVDMFKHQGRVWVNEVDVYGTGELWLSTLGHVKAGRDDLAIRALAHHVRHKITNWSDRTGGGNKRKRTTHPPPC